MVITTDWINWDEMNHDFMPTNEVSRAFLASFILVMDLLIVMQVRNFYRVLLVGKMSHAFVLFRRFNDLLHHRKYRLYINRSYS